MNSYSNGHGTVSILPPTTKVITGASLVHRRLSKTQRAVIAADIIDGSVTFIPTKQQVATACGVSQPYVDAARKLAPGKGEAILRDWDPTTIAELMPRPTRQLQLKLPAPNSTIPDRYLEMVIKAVGIDRALEAAMVVESNS
jgi:hypothetical protein